MANILAMKTILTKFKIKNITYLMILTFLLTGYIKNICLILAIIIFHELGHVYYLRKYEYEIESITIYPFGGLTKTNKLLNTPIKEDLRIYFGGVFFQIILYLIFWLLFKFNIIYVSTFNMFLLYNSSILLFNLLPIRPLDGGELLKLLLEKKLTFQKAYHVMNYISFIGLGLFLVFNYQTNLNAYLVGSYLLVKFIEIYQKQPYTFHKFLLERFLYVLPYQKIEHNDLLTPTVLKKDTLHFFKKNNRYYHEKEILAKKFDRNTYF